ncbi:MAG: hypothetical protein HY248_00790, partial [Fimbriimonas ginsengisoli]|nr:hypothetical protein [Fimbriimonas ginsengisoli]
MTLLATMILIGASTPPKELKLEITGAALFKNGYAVVQREAAIPSSGEFVVKLLPQATYGTLWITTTAGTTVSDIATRNELRTTQGSLTTVASLLGENVGKTFTLELRDSGKVTGKLVSQSSEMVVVSDGKESHVVPLAEIRRVSTQEQLKTTWSGATADRVLQLRVDAGPGARVRITGLEAGLTWAPAYSLDIAKPDKAGLLAKATVVNELEDMADRELRLVTGYPNAAFSGSIDPLVSTSSVFQTAASGGQGGFGGAGGRGVTANQAVRFDANDQSLAFQPPAPASAEGASAEDLFLFPLAHVSLKKSDRGYFSLLQATIPYEHLYTWDAPESRVGNALGDPQQTSDQAGDVVWHSVRITN